MLTILFWWAAFGLTSFVYIVHDDQSQLQVAARPFRTNADINNHIHPALNKADTINTMRTRTVGPAVILAQTVADQGFRAPPACNPNAPIRAAPETMSGDTGPREVIRNSSHRAAVVPQYQGRRIPR